MCEEALKATAKEIKSDNLAYMVANVAQEEDVKRYVAETIKKFGRLDILFANAGIEGIMKPIEEYPMEVFDKVFAVNVRGTFLSLKYAIPYMANGGSIIITSSIGGFGSSPLASAYVATEGRTVIYMDA